MSKKVVRCDCYETNSSAMHSLVVSKEGLAPSALLMDEDGYIIADFGYFPEYDEGITTYDQSVKLSYLATEVYYLYGLDSDIETKYAWECISEAVCKYAHAKGIKIMHQIEPELNHQAQPEGELKFVDYYNEENVQNFIFNKYIGIQMTSD